MVYKTNVNVLRVHFSKMQSHLYPMQNDVSFWRQNKVIHSSFEMFHEMGTCNGIFEILSKPTLHIVKVVKINMANHGLWRFYMSLSKILNHWVWILKVIEKRIFQHLDFIFVFIFSFRKLKNVLSRVFSLMASSQHVGLLWQLSNMLNYLSRKKIKIWNKHWVFM